ncbi:Alpha-ketoglutarate-dependent dioxygenase AlkB-like [Trypanosoma melophagium]|uniref:Alpha-ketoglutarate-dependent dioxygenase AlkB-like n=1 Tax=Trypanosoma melophagium TaxID=715481 RepID=UPI00351A0D3C|nr:Alpha-ketoglutarate-dependent dioxygenase AlkB-like [Trypanosoma melophagium]
MTSMMDYSPKELAKARSRCRKWILCLTKYVSPLAAYTGTPDNQESLGFIALNAGVQAGTTPFDLRQVILAQTRLKSEDIRIYFSSLLPFALVSPSGKVKTLTLSLDMDPVEIEVPNEGSVALVYMIPVPNIWKSGSSPNRTLSLLYMLYCKADAVLHLLQDIFQPITIGAEKLLLFSEKQPQTETNTIQSMILCKRITEVPGIFIVEDFITQDEHDTIWDELKGPTAAILEKETLARRSVAHFNRRFYYGVNKLGKVGESVNANPAFYNWMQRRLRNEDSSYEIYDYPTFFKSCSFDQLTVNFYNYDSKTSTITPPGIAHHVDAHSPFSDCILVVSLGSHTVMEFSRYDRSPEVAAPVGVLLPPKSLLLMTGEARYAWKHGISEKRVDILADFLPPLHRGDRISLTWRCGRDELHRKADCMWKDLCDGI